MKMKRCLSLVVVMVLIVSLFAVAVGSVESEEHIEAEKEESVDDSDDVELQDLADSPWPSFGRDRKNTGLSPYDTSHVDGTEKWNFETGNDVSSSPAIGEDGMIYVGSNDNNLYAVNPNGTEMWSFETEARIMSSPAIGEDGTIYVGSDDNNLYAVNPNGTERWSFETEDRIFSSPAIGEDGTIYVGSEDNNLYAVNPDGTEKWSFETEDRIFSSPAIGEDGTIYVGSWDNNLYAVNPDGTEKWSFETGGSVNPSPVIGSDGTVYVGSSDNNLYAVNPNGTERWSFETSYGIHASPAIGKNGSIYVRSEINLYAVNQNGTERWSFETGSSELSPPAVGEDGTIYVGSYDNNLYAVNQDGTERWSFETGYRVFSSPAIDENGIIYVPSGDNNLYAIGNEDNEDDHTLSINVEGEGSTDPPAGEHTYQGGEEVTVTATPAEGWDFVEWTGDVPEGEEENKEITIEMDSDKYLTAHFETTTEGYFEVNFDYIYPEEVEVGEYVESEEIKVENIGDKEDTQDIIFYVEDEKEKVLMEDVTLGPEESLSMWFSWEVVVEEEGEYELEVASEDHSDTQTIYVEVPDEPYFAVDVLHPEDGDTFAEGKEISVEYEVKNYGGTVGAQSIEFEVYMIEGEELIHEDIEGNISLESGDSYSGTFSWDTTDEEWKEYSLQVESEDSADSTRVLVVKPGTDYFEVDVLSPDEGSVFVEGDEITVEYLVENFGEIEGMQKIDLIVDTEVVDSEEINLTSGESYEGELIWDSTGEDLEEYDLQISSEDDEYGVNIELIESGIPYFEVDLAYLYPEEEVSVGEELRMEILIENVGEEVDTQDIVLFVGGEKEKVLIEDLTVGPGEALATEQMWEVVVEEEGEYELEVASEDHSDTQTIYVEVPDEPYFAVDILHPEDGDTFAEGKEVIVEYEIGNYGENADTQNISFYVDEELKETEEITLDGGDVYQNVFSWIAGEEGEYELLVSSEDDDDAVTVIVGDEVEHYELLIDVEGGGTTNPEPGVYEYEEGTLVNVTAHPHPDEGWEFVEWTGDVDYNYTDEEYITIEMDQHREITANFEEIKTYELAINVEGEGTVTVEWDDEEHVVTDEIFDITESTEVSLTADSEEDWYFDGWTGDYEGTEEEITVTMDEDKEITAVFEEVPDEHHVLTINVEGEGSTDPSAGEHTYEDGEKVTVKADSDDGWEFIEWTGDYEGPEEEITITMDEDKHIIAHFEEKVQYHNLTIDIEGEGTTDPLPGLHEYEEGTWVNVTAYPDEGWDFVEWTGDYESEDQMIHIHIDEDKQITAIFEEEILEAYFEVEITDYDEEVDEGETGTVEYTVENTGEIEDTQTIVFSVNGIEELVDDVTLGADEEYTSQATWEAEEEGEYELEVASDDDSDSVIVTVEEELDPAYFEVEITDYDEVVEEGDTVTVEFTVTNTGDEEATQDIAFSVDGAEEDREEGVTLGSGETYDGEFEWEAEEAGEYDLEVASEDDSDSVTTIVEELNPAYFEVEITDYEEEVDEGDTVTVEYIVENTGDVEGTQEIVFFVGGDQEDSMDVTIEANEENRDEFTWEADEAGEYEIEVASEDTYDSVTITIEETEYDLAINIEGEGFVEVDGEEVEDGWIGTYDRDTEVELEADPDEDWYFVKWTGDHVGTSEEITITMDNDLSITAEFDEEDIVDEYDLTVESTEGGEVVQPGEGTFEYEHGEVLLIEAVPADDYEFVEWTGDTETIGNPNAWLTTIEMVDDHEITANFAEETYELDISSLEGGQIEAPGEGTFDYTYGTEVEIEAEVEEHYNFGEWIGDTETIDDTESSETTITMEDDYQIMALFEKDTHQLEIEAGDGGKVTITGEGTFQHGIFEYDHGEEEILNAVADGDQQFKEWTGDTEEIENVDWKVTRINMTDDFNITAEFEDKGQGLQSNTYDSEIYGTESHELKIDSTRGGYLYLDDERKEGEFEYGEDDEVELRALADDHHHFVEWVGDNETMEDPTSSEVTIEMNSEKVLVAQFARDTHDLNISWTEGGEVEAYGGDEFGYEVGETIVLEASVEDHHHFVEWVGEIGDIEDPNSRLTTMEMTGEQEITANFAPNVYELTIQSTVGGEVVAPGEDTFTYEYGEIDLEAIEEEGYQFVEWIGDNGTIEDLTADETTIEITDDIVIMAEFSPEIEEEDDIGILAIVGIVVIIAIILAIIGYMMMGSEGSEPVIKEETSMEEEHAEEEIFDEPEETEEELFEEESEEGF